MLDVGAAAAAENRAMSGEDADLAVFVDRLAAAGSDRPTGSARAQIRRAIAAGDPPPGLRRLAEALAASVAEAPPQRRPSDDASSVVTAMHEHALVVLEDFDAAAVAGAVTALLADGKRVVVTAATPAELTAVRDVLHADVADRVLDRLPAMAPRELRELRRLLATSTPERRARADQRLPAAATLPPWDDVAQLCLRADRSIEAGPAATMVPALLADLDRQRREAVVSVARCVDRSLGALRPRSENEWAWRLLSDLVYSRHRPAFDRMLEITAQAGTALERARYGPPVTVAGPLPANAVGILRRYREFFENGGRSRPFFGSGIQREVMPVLRLVRIDGRTPDTEAEIGLVIDHLDLGERLSQIDAGCAEIGIPPPHDEGELVALTDGLRKVGAAARSVGAFRHDVLFIAAESPLSVPDVETAAQVAAAVLDYADHGSAAEASHKLDRLAGALAEQAAVASTAPEHDRAVAALRARDADAYGVALDALGAARREAQDESRRVSLLRRLSQGSPKLAGAWAERGALGFACFAPADALLSAIPASDSADVVLVLGSARLGVERLLLGAVAPRMIAAIAPGERSDASPSLLSVLRRATALVIRGRAAANGQVVRLVGPQRTGAGPAAVGQAGA